MGRKPRTLRVPVCADEAIYKPESPEQDRVKILLFIRHCIMKNACAPVMLKRKEILDATGIHQANFARLITELEECGWFVSKRGEHYRTPTRYTLGKLFHEMLQTK